MPIIIDKKSLFIDKIKFWPNVNFQNRNCYDNNQFLKKFYLKDLIKARDNFKIEKMKTSLSGIILCLISQIDTTISIEKIKTKNTTKNKNVRGENKTTGRK